ncbi:MAG: STAS domain-containing protein, partial [Deltaproteobacteria bacterium]|nr:STAS domain-containing protein [Deltaproteobacteria bacterium]
LARTSLNMSANARTRLSGIFNGLMVLLVLVLFGKAFDLTPIAALAGLLMIVAVDLVDVAHIKRVVTGRPSDALAFGATLIGTWALPLDKAIYLGVAISLVMFLRRARLLVIRAAAVGPSGRMQDIELDQIDDCSDACRAVRILHVEGQLFFASANELQSVLDEVAVDRRVKVIVLRIKRAHGLDHTTLSVLISMANRLRDEGRHLMLVGMRPRMMEVIERTGASNELGEDNLFPTTPRWFEAMNAALAKAQELAGEHECRDIGCPMADYLAAATGPD